MATVYPRTARSPMLLPDFDIPIEQGRTLNSVTSGQFSALYQSGSSVAGSGTITIGGTTTTGDTATVTLSELGGAYTATGTATAGTNANLATALANAINAGPVGTVANATVAGAVITLKSLRPGPLSNIAFTTSKTGTSTIAGVQMTGGAGNVVTPLEVFNVQYGHETLSFYPNRPVIVDSTLATMLANSDYLVV